VLAGCFLSSSCRYSFHTVTRSAVLTHRSFHSVQAAEFRSSQVYATVAAASTIMQRSGIIDGGTQNHSHLLERNKHMTQPTNVGVVGCGNISGIYLEAGKKWDILNIGACPDIDMRRAQAKAQKYGVPKACSVEELLTDPMIEIVINLTVPQAHAEVALAALAAGKSVYNEKPLAIEREPARRMLDLARERGLRVG